MKNDNKMIFQENHLKFSNHLSKSQFKEEIKIYLENNNSENTTLYTIKTLLRGKFISLNIFLLESRREKK